MFAQRFRCGVVNRGEWFEALNFTGDKLPGDFLGQYVVLHGGCFVVASASVHVALAGPKALAAHRAAHARLAGVDPERPEADGFAIAEPHGGHCVMF